MVKSFYYKAKEIHINNSGSASKIEKGLLKGRFYEASMLSFIEDNYPNPGAFIDVGANIGNHTLFMAGVMGWETIAFEPFPSNYTKLLANLSANSFPPCRVMPLLMGAGSVRGNKELTLRNQEPVSIKVKPLDDCLPALRGFDNPLRIIKIDVDGSNNLDVLAGARVILTEMQPDVFIECHTDFKAISEHLSQFGYKYTGKVFNASPTYLFSV